MESIAKWFAQHQITEVECLIPDLTGNARGKIIPAKKYLREGGMRLPESIFFQTVTGEWPEDEGLFDWTEKDMQLEPDESSLRLVPWAKEPTAQLIHDCFDSSGELIGFAPRSVLKRVLKLYEDEGWRPIVAPELEFFLVKKNLDWDYPLQPPEGRNGRPETARQSFSIDAVNEFDPVFEDMYDYCDIQQLEVDTLVHESGAAQMEINFDHGEALNLCDQVFLFKRTMREAALAHDIYATFMAKPMEHEPGSAMHIHQSLLDGNGNNLFSQPDGQASAMFSSYLAGLQHFTPAAISFYAPNVNSYRRLMFGDSAPINLQWGVDNRSVGLRVPRADPANRRVENRFAGADANPYLAMAVTLACGYLGMKRGLKPNAQETRDVSEHRYALPGTLEEALFKLERSDELKELLGEHFVNCYVAVKRKEYQTYFKVISSWEREYLLLNV
ncbi:glutamine synthetase family protein [Aliagarivorans taiwanensis]|uniref:glutamine synthetase family protein n=1 Tax=Aliagarivorans taiwanensis TaxID=561966 RepID=UPI0003FE198E|nr:glutamine synthetase family protein [Aliagarivorans taiwanensis]